MSLVLGSQTLKFAAVIKRQWLLVRVASPSVQVLNLPEHSLTKEPMFVLTLKDS